MNTFTPTREAALAQLATVNPEAYARSRNFLEGAVTRLSPYLTHGLLSLREVYTAVHARHPLEPQHKLVFELGWRAYYRHVWAHRGDGILQSLHAGLHPEAAYATTMPADVQEARTGIPAIDLAVRTLYATGYVHNHARMWLASYLVHLRKVHWRVGAQWMLGYLLDGDVASNSLSWQWVAGTGSVKPYLFNAENVAKYAPAPWHSFGTVLDTTYEALDAMARSPQAVHPEPLASSCTGLAPPALHTSPLTGDEATARAWEDPTAVDPAALQGRDVWLHHLWALHADPALAHADAAHIGVGFAECHAATPWSAQRWGFVSQGLQATTAQRWWGNPQTVAHALRHARSVHWHPDPHGNAALAQLADALRHHGTATRTGPVEVPALFGTVRPLCPSFASWWKQARLLA